jgi:3-isopropylmalate dehydrogenase
MCLRYSLNEGAWADRIERAVQDVLKQGIRTGDIMAEGCKQVGTVDMGATLIRQLEKTAAKAA